MKQRSKLLLPLLGILLSIPGCGDPPAGAASKPRSTGSKSPLSLAEVRAGRTIAKDDGNAVDDKSVYVWDEERIRARHETITMVPLPAYAEQIEGSGGFPRDDGGYASWTFHIPAAHIEEFKKYILDLGVPERCLAKPGVTKGLEINVSEPGWPLPDPPAKKLLFKISYAQPGQSTEKWIQGETMTFFLYNPNINHRSIGVSFSAQTGWVEVFENHLH